MLHYKIHGFLRTDYHQFGRRFKVKFFIWILLNFRSFSFFCPHLTTPLCRYSHFLLFQII